MTQKSFLAIRQHLQKTIIGQSALLDRMLIGLLADGHVLLEGPPGLAKTTAVNALASGIHASFQRIQFTPDLMPADLTGSDIFSPSDRSFHFVKGPLFHEIILADEINRAPPKVQSALLEAMQEHQITVSGVTHPLSELFMVLATQNPLEQSGTYPLPEAQLDRFLLHVVLDYPNPEDELLILKQDRQQHAPNYQPDKTAVITLDTLFQARQMVADIHVEEVLETYIVNLISTTRNLGRIDPEWGDHLRAGASPRASIALLRASTALAFLNDRDYVIPEDIIEVAPDVIRHRLMLSHHARAAGISADDIIQHIIANVPVP